MKLELICFLYDKKLADMDIEHDDIEASLTIDSDDIKGAREVMVVGENELSKDRCIIYCSFGHSFEIKTPYREIIKYIK